MNSAVVLLYGPVHQYFGFELRVMAKAVATQGGQGLIMIYACTTSNDRRMCRLRRDVTCETS